MICHMKVTFGNSLFLTRFLVAMERLWIEIKFETCLIWLPAFVGTTRLPNVINIGVWWLPPVYDNRTFLDEFIGFCYTEEAERLGIALSSLSGTVSNSISGRHCYLRSQTLQGRKNFI